MADKETEKTVFEVPEEQVRGKVEEITDLVNDDGIRELPLNTILVFDFEGSRTNIRIIKKDLKQMKVWGEHVDLTDGKIVGKHFGHNVDTTKDAYTEYGAPYCSDCEVPVTQPSTEDGEVKAAKRKEEDFSDAEQ